MTSLLVVRPSSLGDIVHAMALVDDVRRALPDATIDWVAEEAFVELPSLCPDVGRVVPLALRRWRHSPFMRGTWREAKSFRDAILDRQYDVILDLQEQVKGAVVSRLARGVRHGFDRASIREPVAALFDDVHHAVPRNLHFATRCRQLAGAALRIPVDGLPRWRLRTSTHAAIPSERYMVALHATSRADKLWPENDWRALLTDSAHAGLACVLPWGSEIERERSERLANGVATARVPARHTLGELAALLARAELVVGVDTGLTHLAAALGTPVIALFTATDPAGAGVAIAGEHARDLGGNGRVPTLQEVLDAAGDLLRC
ncbi:MAG TPA: lipopolysaccharide heptosyltransferase I [Casimicrobiaceae bacterium]|nr:lipopolysaccharide heptosyltransferase I [Casimicrobiaceae bacterium]